MKSYFSGGSNLENKASKILFCYKRTWQKPKKGTAHRVDFDFSLNYYRENFSYEDLVDLTSSVRLYGRDKINSSSLWRAILKQEHKPRHLYDHVAYFLPRRIINMYLKSSLDKMPLYINRSDPGGSIAAWRLKNGR